MNSNCAECLKEIVDTEFYLLPNKIRVHIECFVCDYCTEKLSANFVHFEGKRYHSKCIKEKTASKCGICTHLIIDENAFEIKEDFIVHQKCFCCFSCKELLDEEFFESDSRFYHPSCFKNMNSFDCRKCHSFIRGSKFVKYNNYAYHAECFRCNSCDLPIGTKLFCSVDGQIQCEDCLASKSGKSDQKIKVCNFCLQVIKKYDRIVILEENNIYHESCFACKRCQKCIDKEYISENSNFYHRECHQLKNGCECFKCLQVIMPGCQFITYNNHKVHSECFQCKYCNASVAQKRFLPLNEIEVKCEDCIASNIKDDGYHNCINCMSVIQIGESYIDYEDSLIHEKCFTCMHCQLSIPSGRRFRKLDDFIECEDCIRKLMYSNSTGVSSCCIQLIADSSKNRLNNHLENRLQGISIQDDSNCETGPKRKTGFEKLITASIDTMSPFELECRLLQKRRFADNIGEYDADWD